ncbi:hypothetical protein [Bacillus pinisoli]|uniref:hypothetical protein n=1 Tax=Bacillus pinisoli TaxID=2901866 RepID=UPI001FF43839|nr:hypothetical protein [Bacillus pinisoli]
MTKSSEELFQVFKQLWSNRVFEDHEDVLAVMKRTIQTDLKDELSHPRVRSTPHKKFSLAIKRITQTNLSAEDQLQIISLYLEELEHL